jgi:transcriptional regulator with XRE-family HTH domain
MVETLGQVILARRAELGWTQEQLAERIGDNVRQSEISRLERDHIGLPRRYRLEQIARALDIPLGELLLRSGWAGAGAVDESSAPVEAEGRADHELQAANAALQVDNDRLESEAGDHRSEMAASVVIVDQLRAILNGVYHAVVVVNPAGLIVLENTAYAVFAATHTDAPDMIDDDGGTIADRDVPLERAARGERFTMA